MNAMLNILAVLVAALVFFGANAYAANAKNSWVRNSGSPELARVPVVSSPQVSVAGNGDRVSQYPPYFHPESLTVRGGEPATRFSAPLQERTPPPVQALEVGENPIRRTLRERNRFPP